MEKLYGVIGDPIAQSMSPDMHNSSFKALGLEATYKAFHVTPERLESALEGVRGLGMGGLNVTIPHKVSVMKFLDEIDPLASKIGAVNTVVNENGKLIGYNTDGMGYVTSLKEILQEKSLENSSILLIGAGGAARAIYFSLLEEGVKQLDIANRTVENARTIINGQPSSLSKAMGLLEAENDLHAYDVIINTTSIGMYPNKDDIPLSLHNIKSSTIVSDIIYNPLETRWLQEARAKGAITQNGVGMFVFQGALAFEKWTGIYPDIDIMRNAILTKLGGTHKC
ncbi:shikimate dehydrogenase [Bacillus mesophilus]|uniref:Shikimate dehydrogenase (NADP(+)) n=1 Tax=Bacillus mesophilus TaxID=1808955 RepID=A0A6M0Q5Y2_9BACI|nr:shikimate dehydrogenase [Bacillus mesophilus]MBM7660759.1 shikimate dehydrogenase [Bacillus mesophilus]NEY71694.1 shikimate dehydrogenase [Bacillus mesophilus]